jgi:hypothetical protein
MMYDELISRQAAIEIVEEYTKAHIRLTGVPISGAACIVADLEDLPPAEPERKQGEWIKHEHGYWTRVNEHGERDGWLPDYECSLCGSRGWTWMAENMNFCPNCGAKMEGGVNDGKAD